MEHTEEPRDTPKPGRLGWAVVTGASSGIGLAFARELARRGHPVLAVARREERLAALRVEVTEAGGRLEFLAEDLTSPGAAARVIDTVTRLGELELLVNNAGYGANGAFASQALERELDMIALNVTALVELTHRALALLLPRRQGGVINVASIGSFLPVPYFATYSATKAFVMSFSEAVATEVRASGVRVLCVCPGATKTEFSEVAGVTRLQDKVDGSPMLMSAEQLVDEALSAYDQGRVLKVAGLLNALGAVLVQLAPRALVRSLAGFVYRPKPPPRALPPA